MKSIYQKAFEAVQEGTIEAVQKFAYELFHHPVALSDTSFEMLAFDSLPNTKEDEIWNSLSFNNKVPYNIIELFQEHHLIEEVISHPHQTICCNWGWFAEHPRLTTGVFVEDELVGYVAVLIDVGEYPKVFDEYLQIVADAFAIVLKQMDTKISAYSIRDIVARDLFSHTLSLEEIENILEQGYLPKRDAFQVIATSYSPYQKEFRSIISRIQNPNILYFPKDHVLYILTSISDNYTNDGLLKILLSQQYKCGISSPFQDLNYLENYEKQSYYALEMGKLIDKGISVYEFNDYANDILISLCQNPSFLVHPLLYQLRRYDQKHETEYFHTLEIYLQYSRNQNGCLEVLHVHRNTLSYRLKKIEELGKVHLDDQGTLTHLYLSYKIFNRYQTMKKPKTATLTIKKDPPFTTP